MRTLIEGGHLMLCNVVAAEWLGIYFEKLSMRSDKWSVLDFNQGLSQLIKVPWSTVSK